MASRSALAALILGLLTAAAIAQEPPQTAPETDAARHAEIAAGLFPSLVQAEYTLKMHEGQRPRASGWIARCPYCLRYHVSGGGEVVTEERPYETFGLVVSATEILMPDPMIHPRFVEKIEVRVGEKTFAARPAGYALEHATMILKTDVPLPGVRPLVFDARAAPPYLTAGYEQLNGAWTVTMKPFSLVVSRTRDGRLFHAPSPGLVISSKGKPVALSTGGRVPPDDSWKGSPLDWKMITEVEMSRRLAGLTDRFARTFPRVTLNLRSVRKDHARSYRMMERDDQAAVNHALGAMVGPDRVLVLKALPPKVTARLERISVSLPGQKDLAATFECSYRHYGFFTARLEKPVTTTVAFSPLKVEELNDHLLLSARCTLKGEERTTFFGHSRISSVEVGWRRTIKPDVRGDEEDLFLFDLDGGLLALPVPQRRAGADGRWDSAYPSLTTSREIQTLLKQPVATCDLVDAGNVPLSEEEENRVAWLGTELQPLTRDLARVNKVSHLTNDGTFGAIVSYIYPGSIAEKLSLQLGDILLTIKAPHRPVPVQVRVEPYRFGGQQFPWERLSMLDERFFDRIPMPWTPVETAFTRALTDIGLGKQVTLKYVRNGKTRSAEFVVTQSPPHYNSATRYKSQSLGLTVRNMTYEVRRYFRKTPDDPGVIISKIQSGSRASVSGLKPYEIITQINEQPVKDVKDVERLVTQAKDLRLSVLRMDKGRVVKMTNAPVKAKEKNAKDAPARP